MKLVTDEHISLALVRGLLRRLPELDIVALRDTELLGKDDPTLLEWAATENRIILTQDVSTLPDFAYERIEANLPMPGVFVLRRKVSLNQLIEDLVLIAEASEQEEWTNLVTHVPI
jgi:predicted nuclease of predicted toxin-antitoxin system